MPRDLAKLFSPQSVAVVGASERPTSSGGAVMRMLRRGDYGCNLIPVNPKGGTCFGLPVVKAMADISPPADLVVVVVRPELINQVVREAVACGHKDFLVLPGGFAETGPDGMTRDSELRQIAANAGVTVAGPNCAGIVKMTAAGRAFAPTFLRDLPAGPRKDKGVAFITQSGALAEEIVQKSNDQQLPLSHVVSAGNAMHLGVEDYLEHLGSEDLVSAATLYIESVADPEHLRQVARRVTTKKPVLALFGGATQPGAFAAQAHTGAAPNTDEAIDAFCAESGIIRVRSIRELLLAIKGFGFYPRGLASNRVLVLSNSGGPGVVTTDMAAASGLALPPLPNRMADELGRAFPDEASVANPLDLLADAREDRFGLSIENAIRYRADTFDAILGIHVVPFMVDAAPVVDRWVDLADQAHEAGVAIFHSMMGTLEQKDAWFAGLEDAGIPTFNDSQAMAETAAILARYPVARAAAQAALAAEDTTMPALLARPEG